MHQNDRAQSRHELFDKGQTSTISEQRVSYGLWKSCSEFREAVARFNGLLEQWGQDKRDQECVEPQQDLLHSEIDATDALLSLLSARAVSNQEMLLKVTEVRPHITLEALVRHPDVLDALMDGLIRDFRGQAEA